MPKLPGVSHQEAVRALERAGFWIKRQSKHIIMTNGTKIIVVPRGKPIKPMTMGGIARDAGFTVEEFGRLL